MKRVTLFLGVVLLTQFIYSQQAINAKRIEINNPSQNQLMQIKNAGFDLGCDAIFNRNNVIMELSQEELTLLDNQNINYVVLIDDLIGYYQDKTERELPLAKVQLEQLKARSTAISTSRVSSVSVDNLIQYEGCEEVNWAVPTNFNLGSMGGCLTYSEVLAELDQMRALYPNLISVKTDASPTNQLTHGNSFNNGGQYNTWSGQTIYYVRISDNPDIDEANEPESLYSGMTHAREVSSMMNLMYYMWYLLENYNSDAGIKNLIDTHEMYFIPVANPDGLLWNEQIAPNGGGLQRKNLGPYNTGNNDDRGVDLNRNYDYFWGSNPIYGGSSGTQSSPTYRGPSAFSEPETQIVRDFSALRNFKTAMNHHATSNLIPHAYNGYPAAPPSGREAEYAKFCHDMTRYNRYIYGEAPDILTIANGDMSDWMLGGAADVNGSTGSGQSILALAPENGAWDGSEGSFWPNASDIVNIAQRAVRMNFVNAYHSGKFAQFHDLNTTDITNISGNLEFGIEYLGQTLGDITLDITPVSSNISSITPPGIQTGWSKLEQRTVTATYSLNAGIQPQDEIEFQVTLSNDDGYVMYQANITKTYNPSVLFDDDPDVTGIGNWTTSGGTWGTTTDAYSGSAAITDSPFGAYANNTNTSISMTNFIDISGATAGAVVQFYAKWDLERNFDFVQIQGSTNGTNWVNLCGKYTKPGSDFLTNRYNSSNSSNTSDPNRTSTTNQPSGALLYDGDTMDKWVMEEIVIDASNNTALFGQGNVKFRFVLDSDNTNRADGYPTTFDGFSFDDFKVISLQTPCILTVPTGLTASASNPIDAIVDWDTVVSATYDLRYRETGSPTWIDVFDLANNNYNLTGLTPLTEYEVQIRSACDGPTTSAYSSSFIFTTTDVVLNYCSSASTNVNDEFISRVQLNTIDNSSGAQFYSDFTSISTTLTKDSQYTITVTPTWIGTVYNEAYSVWIDYNRDGDFADAGEQVWTQGNTQISPVIGNFTVPSSAVENSTRMRVSMKYNALPTSCETFTYGEVEDYTVIIEGSGPDTTPPVITLNGASTIDLDIGDTYTEQGATALDNIDGDISLNIVIGGDTVDTNTAGTYLVTYNVSDAANNAAIEVIRTVNMNPDTTVPIITLNGASTIDLNVGDIYTELGAAASDNIDGDISANIVIGGDIVDNNIAGTYLVSYNVSDAAGNPATEVVRTVNVVADTTAPIITLNGASVIDLDLGSSYTEEGATATDNIDGDITASIVIGGDPVDINTAGSYLVTYDVNDSAGNPATQVIRTVNVIPDTTAPIITLNGASVIDLDLGIPYTEQGATATDNIDGDITASIVIGGDPVDINTAGSYLLSYDVSDAAGNPATQVIRTINVTEPSTGCSNGISSFPYTEGFENSLGAWTQSSADDTDWTIDTDGTQSNGTGPSGAAQGSYYIYVEASGNGTGYPNKQALITSPCFDLSGETVASFSFKYHQYGSADMGTLDLEASSDDGITWQSIWNSSGNLGNSWQTATLNLTTYLGGGLQLRFNRITGSNWQADIAIDDVSLTNGTISGCSGGFTSYPYSESFESSLGAWTQSNVDDTDWTRDANGTPSNNTGPSGAVDGSFYMFVEASGNGTGYPNKRAILNSPCFDLSSQSSATFSFSYHMFGASDMGTIALEASNDSGFTWSTLWSESGNKGDVWFSINIDLSAYIGNSVQLRFNRVTGSTWKADIAIDNINLSAGSSARLSKSNNTPAFLNLNIYPNPVKDSYLHVRSNIKNLEYQIFNIAGQWIAKGKVMNDRVDVSELESAVYLIEFNSGEQKSVKRFIKD